MSGSINTRFGFLIGKFLRENLAEDERAELDQYLHTPANRTLFDEITNNDYLKREVQKFYDIKNNNSGWQYIINDFPETDTVPMQSRVRWLRIAVAATIIGLLMLGAYSWFARTPQKEVVQTVDTENRFKNDVAPGTDKAILTLADGRTIILDSTIEGILAKQGNTTISNSSGQLAYMLENRQTNKILFNTVSTQNGGQYAITLADGTKAWLNAASTLHFPTAFVGSKRKVEITGEVYFEVAEDAAKPFIVTIKTPAGESRGEIEVLGTHFNVNAYNDNSIVRTTLLEGSVKVSSGSKSTIIKPNQQAQITNDRVTVINDPDIEQAMAWKNGLFFMAKQDIKSIMKEVQRWYNVDIEFAGAPITGTFSGKISRKEPVSKLLMILELTEGVRFEIEDNKIIVMSPK